MPDDEATRVAVSVGLRLWRPAAEPFRWIGDHVPRWLDEAERSATLPGRDLITFARTLYSGLDVGRATIVHGDFHHHNIVDAGGRHLAIDAKAMLGEPEYDVPSFLWNPLPCRMRLDVTERRLAAFAAPGSTRVECGRGASSEGRISAPTSTRRGCCVRLCEPVAGASDRVDADQAHA